MVVILLIFKKKIFFFFLDFNSSKATDKCYQQPGTFAMQPFWVAEFIKSLLKSVIQVT